MSGPNPRYQVQHYTMTPGGTRVWCVCDFHNETETGRSPIVTDDRDCNRLWTSREEAQEAADALNANE